MNDQYRVPKHKVPVEVILVGRAPMLLYIFLGECAESHAGYERPSDLLNGSEPFFPAADADGCVVFLHRDGLISLTVDAEHEFGGAGMRAEDLMPDHAARAEVEVILEDGMSVTGTITYVMPEGQRRLQDVLNQEDRYLRLHVGDRAHLINKRRIVRVSPVPESREAADGAAR